MSDKLIVEVRINEDAMRDPNPHVPYTPEEIAAQAAECWREGAAIVHYHPRDPRTGRPSSDPALYLDTARRIRRKTDLIVMPTNAPMLVADVQARMAPILAMANDPATKPELAPIDMLSGNLDVFDAVAGRFTTTGALYVNTTGDCETFARTMTTVGIKPVPFLWQTGSVRVTAAFLAMGAFEEPLWCEIALTDGGLLVGNPGTIQGLDALLEFFPKSAAWRWSVLSFGANGFAVAAAAMERGGHVSIGLGDYHYRELGLPSNAELVALVATLARAIGRELATPEEARAIIGVRRPG